MRNHPRDVLRLVLTSVLCVMVYVASAMCAPGTAAADDGVHVDPDSPPGVEYALPLQAARDQAGGSGSSAKPGGSASASSNPPAFGEGITAQGGSSRQQARGSGQEAGTASDGRAGSAPSRSVPAMSSLDDAGDAPMLFSLAGALVVLLVGGLVALSLRARRQTV